jgi:hypothetical protein
MKMLPEFFRSYGFNFRVKAQDKPDCMRIGFNAIETGIEGEL